MDTVAAKKRILIVDDEVSFARMVKLNLEKTAQFEVRTENRASNALSAAREFKPDLILLDVIMPGMDGGDVQNQFRHDRLLREVPIIFLTATVSKREAGEAGLNSGGDLFLAKPISVETLVQCIHERTRKPEAPASDPASEAAATGPATAPSSASAPGSASPSSPSPPPSPSSSSSAASAGAGSAPGSGSGSSSGSKSNTASPSSSSMPLASGGPPAAGRSGTNGTRGTSS
jgi:CheY-like chemotaxis protein